MYTHADTYTHSNKHTVYTTCLANLLRLSVVFRHGRPNPRSDSSPKCLAGSLYVKNGENKRQKGRA